MNGTIFRHMADLCHKIGSFIQGTESFFDVLAVNFSIRKGTHKIIVYGTIFRHIADLSH